MSDERPRPNVYIEENPNLNDKYGEAVMAQLKQIWSQLKLASLKELNENLSADNIILNLEDKNKDTFAKYVRQVRDGLENLIRGDWKYIRAEKVKKIVDAMVERVQNVKSDELENNFSDEAIRTLFIESGMNGDEVDAGLDVVNEAKLKKDRGLPQLKVMHLVENDTTG